jgi:hypothetical protein
MAGGEVGELQRSMSPKSMKGPYHKDQTRVDSGGFIAPVMPAHAGDSSEPPCLLEDQQTRVESVVEAARIFLMPLDLWIPDVMPMQCD